MAWLKGVWGVTTDEKIRSQMEERGWTEKDIEDAIAQGPKGTGVEKEKQVKHPMA